MDFLQDNPLYVVGLISVVIWLGLFLFLLSLDRKVSKLEKGDFGEE